MMTVAQNILAMDIGKIVRDYFYNKSHGKCEAVVSYNNYDIKKYTFRMVCTTLGGSATYCMPASTIDLDCFRQEVRKLLKSNGFTRCKFDVEKVTYTGGAFGDEPYYHLKAIYFDV